MNFIKKSIVTKKRRAVSQVIGSLFALAIVATFGSVLLIQGVQGVENFTAFLNIFEETESKSAQEVFIVEHVKFNSTNKEIDIWVRNTGKIDIIIDKISIVKINSQELIASEDEINKAIFQKEVRQITFTSANVTMPSISCSSCSTWQIVFNTEGSTEYRITVAGLFNS